jgi:hypothetical protein
MKAAGVDISGQSRPLAVVFASLSVLKADAG